MDTPSPSTGNEVTLLIHGLCANRLAMFPLAHRLRGEGFQIENWGYRSLTRNIAFHADRLRESMEKFETDDRIARFHIVAHSLGSIVTRGALLESHPSKLGRIVMLAPPNQGSRAAARLQPFLGWLSPAFGEISDCPDSWVNRLPQTLATKTNVGLILAAGDLVVRPESTELPGIRSKTVIPGMHSGILWKAATAKAVAHFIRFGEFQSS